jgi:hypothetical protein
LEGERREGLGSQGVRAREEEERGEERDAGGFAEVVLRFLGELASSTGATRRRGKRKTNLIRHIPPQ